MIFGRMKRRILTISLDVQSRTLNNNRQILNHNVLDILQLSGLHAVVVCLLLGAVIMVVGLVQLVPGATSDHKITLLISGSILLVIGK